MPMGKYRDFKHCVSSNQDKDNPSAYCANIMRQVEEKTITTSSPAVTNPTFGGPKDPREGVSENQLHIERLKQRYQYF